MSTPASSSPGWQPTPDTPRTDALAFESDADQIPFRIVVAGRKDFAGSEKATALKEAFQSPEVKAWYASYQNGILPTPWDQDPAADVSKL